MNRLFLYSGFLFILILIFDAYDRDYNQPKSSAQTQENNITQSKGSTKKPPTTDLGEPTSIKGSQTARNIQTLENTKLLIEYDTVSGELLFPRLKKYPTSIGSEDKIVILDYDS